MDLSRSGLNRREPGNGPASRSAAFITSSPVGMVAPREAPRRCGTHHRPCRSRNTDVDEIWVIESLTGRVLKYPQDDRIRRCRRYYARQGVLSDITLRLSSYPVLVLQGGTGVGKSVAAAGHAAASTSSWGWVDLRGVSSTALAVMLGRAAFECPQHPPPLWSVCHLIYDRKILPSRTNS
jgi:hypothetical protein